MGAVSQDRWSGQSRGWRYLAQRLTRDGSQGAWLDNELPLADVKITDVLSGPTQLTGKVEPQLARLTASDGEPLLDEWGTAIYAEADGVIRAGAILVSSTKDGPTYTLDCTGFTSYAKNTAYADTRQFRNVDPVDVVRHIWNHIQSGQNSDIGLQVDTSVHTPERVGAATTDEAGNTTDDPFELNWWSTHDLGGEIDTLAGNTPFDYHERHEWNSTKTGVIHRLDFGYPMIGRRRADLRFILGENIQVMPAVERNGEDYANHVIVLGAGEGSAMIRAEARIDDGRLRRTAVIDAKDITSANMAQKLARNNLALRSQLSTITQVVVRDTPGTPIGAWGVGDEIRIIADTDWGPVDIWFQVIALTFTPDEPDIVTMNLARSGHRATLPTSVDRLAVQIAALRSQVRNLSRRPQLPNSSIDNGAVTVTDGQGQVTGYVGQQYDGTTGAVAVTGPRPPRPTAPDITSVVGGVQVTWGDGEGGNLWLDPQPGHTSPVVAPLDFAYVEVQVSDDPTFPGIARQGGITSARGGSITVAWNPVGTPLYARLITWTRPGKYSDPSTTSGPADSGPVALSDLGFNITDYAGGTTIYYGPDTPVEPPEGHTPGDMWLQDTGQTGPDGQPLYLLYRWDATQWRLLQDQGIAESVAQAVAAQATADDAAVTAAGAEALANAAQSTANTALTTANAKITSFYQASAPTSGMASGDFWLDTDDGNKLYRWSGSTWVVVQDAAIQTALTNAGTAQAIADRKVQTFYQPAAPTNPAAQLGVGDLWIDSDNGNRIQRWNGSAWVDVPVGSGALAVTPGGGNLLRNSQYSLSVEPAAVGAEVHGYYAATVTFDTVNQLAGNNSLKTVTDSAVNPQGIIHIAPPATGYPAGTTFRAAVYVKGTAGKQVQVGARAVAPGTGNYVGEVVDSSANTILSGTWQRVVSPAYTPAAAFVPGVQVVLAAPEAGVTINVAHSMTVLGDLVPEWSPNLNARQLGAITTYKQAAAPTAGLQTGDYWLDSDDGNKAYRWSGTAWETVQDAAIQQALTDAATAQATADGKVRIFTQTTAPTGMAAGDVGDLWLDTDDGNRPYTWDGTQWVSRRLGNGAIAPNSLVASNVIATGTVSAALFEALLILTTAVVAGDAAGQHARMDSTGLKVYRNNPDGVQREVGRVGFGPGDFLGGGNDGNNRMAWSIDDIGYGSFQGGQFRNDPYIRGLPFSTWVGSASGSGNGNPMIPGAEHVIGWIDSSIGGVTSEVGLTEIKVEVSTSRWYWIGFDVNYARGTDTEAIFRLRSNIGAPTLSSTEIMRRNFSNGQPFYDVNAFAMGIWYPTISGDHRVLLTAAAQGTGVIDIRTLTAIPAIICIDMGPRKPIVASVNRGSNSSAPAPTQQRYVDLAPAGWASYRGNGTLRTDTTDVVQGLDPSGTNGDGKGYWWFNLPTITGTVDKVEVFAYSNYWNNNTGGTAKWNLTSATGTSTPNFTKLQTDYVVSGYQMPGSKTTTLPTSWWNTFKNRSTIGVSLGPAGSSDLAYTGRFNGADTRLRIWYTQ